LQSIKAGHKAFTFITANRDDGAGLRITFDVLIQGVCPFVKLFKTRPKAMMLIGSMEEKLWNSHLGMNFSVLHYCSGK
jgi:hypothetical protein